MRQWRRLGCGASGVGCARCLVPFTIRWKCAMATIRPPRRDVTAGTSGTIMDPRDVRCVPVRSQCRFEENPVMDRWILFDQQMARLTDPNTATLTRDQAFQIGT